MDPVASTGKAAVHSVFETLPSDKFVITFVVEKVDLVVGNRGNAGNQHFSFAHNVFERLPFDSRFGICLRTCKKKDCW